MRILILDDQPGLAGMLASSLWASGHTAIGFTQPAEVLKVIQEMDVLVTDYHMPEMTGLEVARRAYAQGWRGALLLMSGNPGQIQEPLEHPLLRLALVKPFAPSELVEAISLATGETPSTPA
jgi:CheY-like chemotaxis protein